MKLKNEVNNGQDIIDSRDVIARIAELESLRDDAQELAEGEKEIAEDGTEYYTSVDFGEEEHDELTMLLSLAEEAEGCADWKYGESLIRDSYFERYAQDLAEDIGALKDANHWPCTCIDWERAASELQQDYTSVEFGDVTYWIRS